MRLSIDEHTVEERARYDVYVDGELIPSIAVVDANEECFYARLYRLDAQGHIVFKANHNAPIGEPVHVAQTYMRYGTVEIVERRGA
jgi:hypothetical protein